MRVLRSAPGHSRHSRHPGVSGSRRERTFGQCPRVPASSFIPDANSSRMSPSRPRASARSRALARGPHTAQRRASHIHGDATAAAATFMMRLTMTPSARTSKSSPLHSPLWQEAEARLRMSDWVMRVPGDPRRRCSCERPRPCVRRRSCVPDSRARRCRDPAMQRSSRSLPKPCAIMTASVTPSGALAS